ncbi:MAG: hypothetical protein OXG72_17405 [Acidobacteria bacterium]|nr:hypothetical protein [Acidobacteriota bacterium]
MNTTRYTTIIETISRPDGSRSAIADPPTLLVETSDEDTAARLAANAWVERTPTLPPVGSTIHVHVLRHRQRRPRVSAKQWTIDVYVDTAAQTLH